MLARVRSRSLTRAAVALVSLLRVLAVLVGLQLSGAVHAASEVVELLASPEVIHADACPPDGPCDDCPPGCPNCHCSNAPTAVTPEALRCSVVTLAVAPLSAPRVHEQAPSSPELPLPFRPPRAPGVNG